jgi:hypothetical protein
VATTDVAALVALVALAVAGAFAAAAPAVGAVALGDGAHVAGLVETVGSSAVGRVGVATTDEAALLAPLALARAGLLADAALATAGVLDLGVEAGVAGLDGLVGRGRWNGVGHVEVVG